MMTFDRLQQIQARMEHYLPLATHAANVIDATIGLTVEELHSLVAMATPLHGQTPEPAPEATPEPAAEVPPVESTPEPPAEPAAEAPPEPPPAS